MKKDDKEVKIFQLVKKKPKVEEEKKSIKGIERKIKLYALGITAMIIAIIVFIVTREPKPTALNLIEGIDKNFTYSDITLNIDFKIVDAEEGTPMDVEMVTNVDVVSDEDTQHKEGNLSTSMFGITGNVEVESWQDTINTYTYNTETETWVCNLNQTGMLDIKSVINSIDIDMFETFKLEDYSKQDTEFAITGTLSNTKFFELLKNLVTDDMSLMSYDLKSTDEMFKNATYEFMLVFDRDSRKLTYIQFNLNDETNNVFKFIVKINELSSSKELNIPDEVEWVAAKHTETDASESTTEEVSNSKKIVENIQADKIFFTLEELEELTEGELKADEEITVVVQTLVNEYTEDEYMMLATTWGKLDENLRQAITYIYYKGWVDTARFDEIGVDKAEMKLYYPLED